MNLLRTRAEFVTFFKVILVVIFFLFLLGIGVGVIGVLPDIVEPQAGYIFIGVGFGHAFLSIIAFWINYVSLRHAKRFFLERSNYLPKVLITLSVVFSSILVLTIPFAVYLEYFYRDADKIIHKRFPNETDWFFYKRRRPEFKIMENETQYRIDNYGRAKEERKKRIEQYRKGNVNSVMDNKES